MSASGINTQYPRTRRTGASEIEFLARNIYPITIATSPSTIKKLLLLANTLNIPVLSYCYI